MPPSTELLLLSFHWRKLNGISMLPDVIVGVIFKNGTKLAA